MGVPIAEVLNPYRAIYTVLYPPSEVLTGGVRASSVIYILVRLFFAGLLVTFSQRPLLLNGTTAIVILAHFVLISAFSFGNVSAGLARLPPDYEEVASSLGARPSYRLFKVTLPLIAPYLIAAFGLSFALSMGELGATVMVYPPGWVTLPVAIFGLTDRGDIFSGAALTMILVAATLALLVGLESLPLGAVGRRA